jgi:hypothetical protein
MAGADAPGPLLDPTQPIHMSEWLKPTVVPPEVQVKLACMHSIATDKFLTESLWQIIPGKEPDEGPGLKKMAECIKNTPLPKPDEQPAPDWLIYDFMHKVSINAALAGQTEVKFDLDGVHFNDALKKFEFFAQTRGMTMKQDKDNANLVELIFNDPPQETAKEPPKEQKKK